MRFVLSVRCNAAQQKNALQPQRDGYDGLAEVEFVPVLMKAELCACLVAIDVAHIRLELRETRPNRATKGKIVEQARNRRPHARPMRLRPDPSGDRNARSVPQSVTITDIGNPLGVVAWCSGAAADDGLQRGEKRGILAAAQGRASAPLRERAPHV